MNKSIPDIALGKKLEEARKNLKLSVHDIATQLYLSEDTVTKMENDAFAKDMDVYKRGYLYNYAKAVRLSTAMVDDALIQWSSDKPAKSVPPPEPKPVSKKISKEKRTGYGSMLMKVMRAILSIRNPVKLATFIVFGLLVVLVVVWHITHRGAEVDVFAQEKSELEAAAANIVSHATVKDLSSRSIKDVSPISSSMPHLILAPSSQR